MSAPTKINFKIYQGSTFKEVLRWESSTKGYAPITSITKSAPMVVTSTGHGIPVGWRVKITNVVGMKEVNSSDNYQIVSSVGANTLTFNVINSLSYTDYISGGVIEYNTPIDLAGFTARMQIRAKLDDPTVLKELTTENGGITIDNTSKTIVLTIAATDTSLFTFTSAVYSLEMIEGIEVLSFIYGSISLDKEITR